MRGREYRRDYWLGTLYVFLNNGVWILFPLVIRRAIDDLHSGVTRQKLVTYAFLLLAVAGVKGIFQFLTRWVVIGIGRSQETGGADRGAHRARMFAFHPSRCGQAALRKGTSATRIPG